MRVGYARVSTTDQHLDHQVTQLESAGVEKLFQEQASARGPRPMLDQCLDYVREGDTLVITRLDRIARSTRHLLTISETLQSDGVELVVLDQAIDTQRPEGRLMFAMLGAVAEFESDLLRERQREGIRAAQRSGKHIGRPRALDSKTIEHINDRTETSSRALARELGISERSVRRARSRIKPLRSTQDADKT